MRAAPILRAKLELPLIRLCNASFHRASAGPPATQLLFPNTNLSFPPENNGPAALAIVGASSAVRTDFLNALRGQLSCSPVEARSYPLLASEALRRKDPWLQSPEHAIRYVGFDAERGNVNLRGSYLSQRYESKRQKDDYSVQDLLLGKTALNADESLLRQPSSGLFDRVVADLKLHKLLQTPVSHLSNGQSRRTRIAQALLLGPELLILDSPFMGLDVHAVDQLSAVLESYATNASPSIIVSLRSDEHMPKWIQEFVMLNLHSSIEHQGTRTSLYEHLKGILDKHKTAPDFVSPEPNSVKLWRERHPVFTKTEDRNVSNAKSQLFEDAQNLSKTLEQASKKGHDKDYFRLYRLMDLREKPRRTSALHTTPDGFPVLDEAPLVTGEPLVEMNGVQVSYGSKTVLGQWESADPDKAPGLWWTVRRGERWGVFGPNGSGKTTLTALMTSDHPQSYSLPIQFFGRSRLPEAGKPGISFFDLQSNIGFSSPELHAFFPKHLTIRQALESAWSEAPLARPELTPERDERVDTLLLWFRSDLCPDLGMTELQRIEFYQPSVGDSVAYTGRRLNSAMKDRRQAYLRAPIHFNLEDWSDERTFGSLSFGAQRVLLFLRAIIKRPDIVILDEPFSGMDPLTVVRCQAFLAHGDRKTVRVVKKPACGLTEPFVRRSEKDFYQLSTFEGLTADQTLIFIGHRKEEVPGSIRSWLCLPEPGEGQARFGTFDGPLTLNPNSWPAIWNLPQRQLKRMPLRDRKTKKPIKSPDYKPKSKYYREIHELEEDYFIANTHARRKWWGYNRLRYRADWALRAAVMSDSQFLRVKWAVEMRKPSFEARPAGERLVIQAAHCFHDTVEVISQVQAGTKAIRPLRLLRNNLRLRKDRRPPRSRVGSSRKKQVGVGELNIHGY